MAFRDYYPDASPYAALPSSLGSIVPSKFWGSPVIRDKNGNLSCPGFSGATYATKAWDTVVIPGVPTKSPAVPNGPAQAKTPGICVVRCKKSRDIDKKKIKGGDGGRITLAGLEPAMIEIEIHIWTPQQLEELDKLKVIVAPGPQKQTKTVTDTNTPKTVITNGNAIPQVGSTATTSAAGTQLFVVPKVLGTHKVTKTLTVSQPFDVNHPVFDSCGVTSILFYSVEGPEDSSKVKGGKVFTFKAIEFALPKKGVNATNSPTGAVARGSTLDDTTGQTPGNDPKNTGP